MNIKKLMAPNHPTDALEFDEVVNAILATSSDSSQDLIKKDGEEVSSWRKEADRIKLEKGKKQPKEYIKKLLRII